MTTEQLATPVGNPLPFNDSRHLQAHQFLVDEAYLLDVQQYEAWLDTLTDDICYLMPVRVTTALGAGFDTSPGMAHFDENKYSVSRRVARFAPSTPGPRIRRRGCGTSSPTSARLRVTTARGAGFDAAPERGPGMAHFDEDKYSLSQRVARFATEHAWTEDPPSRLRHYIANVRTFACADDTHLAVESAELLFRSRGDVNEAALVSCGRSDVLRWCGDHQHQLKLARRTITVDESVLRMQNLAVFL